MFPLPEQPRGASCSPRLPASLAACGAAVGDGSQAELPQRGQGGSEGWATAEVSLPGNSPRPGGECQLRSSAAGFALGRAARFRQTHQAPAWIFSNMYEEQEGMTANNSLLFCKAAFLFLCRSTEDRPRSRRHLHGYCSAQAPTGCSGSTGLGSGSQAGAGGRTQKDRVTFGNGPPCRPPSGPALGRDMGSAPGKAQRKPR